MSENNLMTQRLYYLFFLCPGFLLILDLMLLGSGFWSEPLGFSVRKILFAMVCIYSAIYWLSHFLEQIIEYVAVLGLMIFIVVWCLIIPSMKGIGFKDALSDAQLFVGLLFAPAIYSVIEKKGNWRKISLIIFKVSLLLAFYHISVGLFNLAFPESTIQLVRAIKDVLEPLRSEDETSVFIGYVENNLRVFWGSSIYLLAGFYLAIKKLNIHRWVKDGASLFLIVAAIFLTLTRGIILSIPIFLCMFFIFNGLIQRVSNIFLFYFYFSIYLILISVPIIVLSDPSILAWMGVGRDVSDDIRNEQVFSLLNNFGQNFVVGTGFGASADVIRSESAPWSYEMSILALYMKIGLLGILCLIMIFVSFCSTKKKYYLDANSCTDLARLAALTTIIVFCGNTNPYLFSMLGVGLFLFIYFEFRFLNSGLTINPSAPVTDDRIHR